ncbi:MAG: DUF502 domain-containing protein [Planctomycetota bacterium]
MIRRIIRLILGFFRANFFAGLFIALPVGATVGLLIWLWTKLQGPLARVFDIAEGGDVTPWGSIFAAIESSNLSKLYVPLIGLFIILSAVLFLGIITRSILGRLALTGVESVVAHVPIVGMLYMALKQLGEAFITPEGHSKFERPVAVQFPCKGCWAIGFVTGKALDLLSAAAQPAEAPKQDFLTVFVPTSPLPTNGFMLVVPVEETRPLNMPVQDALALVVSGGIINPGDSRRTRHESKLTKIVRQKTIVKLSLDPDPEHREE